MKERKKIVQINKQQQQKLTKKYFLKESNNYLLLVLNFLTLKMIRITDKVSYNLSNYSTILLLIPQQNLIAKNRYKYFLQYRVDNRLQSNSLKFIRDLWVCKLQHYLIFIQLINMKTRLQKKMQNQSVASTQGSQHQLPYSDQESLNSNNIFSSVRPQSSNNMFDNRVSSGYFPSAVNFLNQNAPTQVPSSPFNPISPFGPHQNQNLTYFHLKMKQTKPIKYQLKGQVFRNNFIPEHPHDWPGWSSKSSDISEKFEQILTKQLPGIIVFGRNQVVNYDYIHRSDGYTYFYPINKCNLETHKQLRQMDTKYSDHRSRRYRMKSDVAIPLIKIRNTEIQKEMQQRQKNNPYWRYF